MVEVGQRQRVDDVEMGYNRHMKPAVRAGVLLMKRRVLYHFGR